MCHCDIDHFWAFEVTGVYIEIVKVPDAQYIGTSCGQTLSAEGLHD